jgi:hypothetical protein
MRALRSPSVSGSNADHKLWRAAALLSLIPLIAGLSVFAEESKVAVWKAKEVSFSYRSSVAVYSCNALRDRVITIFRAIGARDDLDVKVTSCETSLMPAEASRNDWPAEQSENAWGIPSDRLFNRSDRLLSHRPDRGQSANVRVRLMMPTEVTPEVIAELDRDKSRRELVSRVTGNPAAGLNVPIAFPAQRQTITLSHGSIGLEPEECELLDQMSTSAFRQLGVRVVHRSSPCDRDRVSHISPKLTVEVLVGVPFGMGNVPPTPAAGDTEPGPSAPAAPHTEPSEPATPTVPE